MEKILCIEYLVLWKAYFTAEIYSTYLIIIRDGQQSFTKQESWKLHPKKLCITDTELQNNFSQSYPIVLFVWLRLTRPTPGIEPGGRMRCAAISTRYVSATLDTPTLINLTIQQAHTSGSYGTAN